MPTWQPRSAGLSPDWVGSRTGLRIHPLRICGCCWSYGVEAAAKEGLFDLAGGSRMEGWWQHYVPYITDRAFLTYLSYEPGASLIMSFECLLIPGLLQTEAYARAILSDCLPRASTVQLDALVELRMERQRRLAEPNHDLRQVYILDEAALHRQTGSARVMAEQMNRLAGAGEDPSITVAVLPFNVTHMGRNGPFLVLESHYGIEDVLFLERVLDDAVLFGDSLAVADLRILFADLLEKALDTAQSKELIRRIAADLG